LVVVVLVGSCHQQRVFQEVIQFSVRLPLMVAALEEIRQQTAPLAVLVVVLVEPLLLKPAAQVILQAPLLHRAIMVETMLRQVISLPVVEEERVRQAKRHQPMQAATVVMGHRQLFLGYP
jgi:hypothetical protein